MPRKPRQHYKPIFIRQWRELKGLSLEDVSGQIGITHATLSRVETGKLGYNQQHLEGVARVLKVEVVDLYRDPSAPADFKVRRDAVDDATFRKIAKVVSAMLEDEAKSA